VATARREAGLVETYRRLRTNGKNHKQALTACAGKLLIFATTVLQRGTKWSIIDKGC